MAKNGKEWPRMAKNWQEVKRADKTAQNCHEKMWQTFPIVVKNQSN